MSTTQHTLSQFPDGAVVIPSRHRAGKVRALSLFPDAIVVVEPHDYAAYLDAGTKNLHVLPADNVGLTFVRNYIVSNAAGRVLVPDDDVHVFQELDRIGNNGFLYWKEGKDAVTKAYNHCMALLAEGYALVGPMCRTNSRLSRGRYRLWACVAINAPLCRQANVNYDPDILSFQDFDFQLTVLNAGLKGCVFLNECFGTPPMGSNVGGCNEVNYGSYTRQQRAAVTLQRFLVKWAHCSSVTVKPTGPEPRISWTSFGHCLDERILR